MSYGQELGELTSCRSCGADIVWMRTVNGKRMPVNADTCEAGETDFERGKHVSHFTTCPQADGWRKSK